MSKARGLHTYTVAEAQNATMGQAGVAFVSDTNTYTPPTGKVVVAIQVIDDITFTTNTTTENGDFVNPSTAGPGTNGNAMSTLTIPSGMTIYGRFTAIDFSGSGKAFLYLG